MSPATHPRHDERETRLLIVDPENDAIDEASFSALPRFVRPGDLIVLNDAATLPAAIHGQTARGEPIELRLLSLDPPRAVLFGAGDHRTRTEDRAPPPSVAVGDRLELGALRAEVRGVDRLSDRLLDLSFDRNDSALLDALYAVGRPVQYAHVPERLALWSVQTLYASRPWAVEMPSAGRPLLAETILSLRRAGAEIVTLTHGAGLSATGDPAIDRALPLPERFEISEATARAVREAERVIAVGTSVVRALEGCFAAFGEIRAASAITSLRIDERTPLHVVDALLTGMHEPGSSHFDLMRAFTPEALLARADAHANAHGYLGHEFGDATVIMNGALPRAERRIAA